MGEMPLWIRADFPARGTAFWVRVRIPDGQYLQLFKEIIRSKCRLTREEAASVIGLGPDQFSHTFSSDSPSCFRAAQMEMRLEMAALLAAQTRWRLSDISDDLGYSSQKKLGEDFAGHFSFSLSECRSTYSGDLRSLHQHLQWLSSRTIVAPFESDSSSRATVWVPT